MKPNKSGLRTWLEIDSKKVAHNYRAFRNLLDRENKNQKVKLMSVVKSNAYGHDIYQFAKLQEKLGADWLGVDSIMEGEALREAGIKIPILVLGYTLPEKFKLAEENNLSLTISTFENLKLLKNFSKLKFHVKIDSGMHRQGFLSNQISKVLEILRENKIKIESFEGLYTHFAAAKNPAFPGETRAQLNIFLKVVEQVKQSGFSPICHAAATSGTIVFPEAHLDLVRIGIGAYGLYPSREVQAGYAEKLNLQPVLTWKSIVSEVKNIPAGEGIGYDFTEKLEKNGQVAIIPIGYWHGYSRSLSSIGNVLINQQKAKVLGRVSMDMLIVDVSKIEKIKTGAEVTLIGENGASADDLALLSSTVNYEIVTRLNPLIKRIYI